MDVSQIQDCMRDFRQNTFVISNSEVESVICNIEAECINFKRLQQQFKSAKISVESLVSEVKSSLTHLHNAPILNLPSGENKNAPPKPHEGSFPLESDRGYSWSVMEPDQLSQASPKSSTPVDKAPESALYERELSEESSIDGSLAPQSKNDKPVTLCKSQQHVHIPRNASVVKKIVARTQPILAPLVQFATPQFKNDHDVRFIAQNCRALFKLVWINMNIMKQPWDLSF